MIGSSRNPELSAKAAETVGLLEFAVELCQTYRDKFANPVQAGFLLASGRAALDVNACMKEAGRRMDEGMQRRMLASYLRHMVLYNRGGGHVVIKHHYMVHMIQKVAARGNPRYYHTYKDESMNGIIARMARTSHRATFSATVLKKYELLMALQPYGVGMF